MLNTGLFVQTPRQNAIISQSIPLHSGGKNTYSLSPYAIPISLLQIIVGWKLTHASSDTSARTYINRWQNLQDDLGYFESAFSESDYRSVRLPIL